MAEPQLAMLECPVCGTQCGKFETLCHHCQASLIDGLARLHNAKRLDVLRSQTALSGVAEQLERDDAHQEAELKQLQMQQVAREMALELQEKYSGRPARVSVWPWIAIAVSALITLVMPTFGLKVVPFLVLTVLVATRVPQRVWLRLSRNARRRGIE